MGNNSNTIRNKNIRILPKNIRVIHKSAGRRYNNNSNTSNSYSMSSNTNSNSNNNRTMGERELFYRESKSYKGYSIDNTRGAVRIVTTPTIEQPNGRAEIKEYQRI